MLICINGRTISKKIVRSGFLRNGGLNPPNGLRNRPKLKSPNTGRSQQGRKHHMIPRRDANDVVYLGVNVLDQPTPRPTGTQHHHPGLLGGLGGQKPGILCHPG